MNHQDDELDNLLTQAIREIDEFDSYKAKTIEEILDETNFHKSFPISPESLSPVSTLNEENEQDMTRFMRFFSNLKTNYLKLCNSYNFLLLKLSDCEMDRSKLYEENLELKKLLKYMIDVNNDHKGSI